MSDEQRSADELLGLFGDELARKILLSASETPLSAEELAERFEVSRMTVYRRLKRLGRYDLLHETIRTDRRGHHHRVFETVVNEIGFRIEDGAFTITVSVEADLVDQFEGFMDGIGASVDGVTREADGPVDDVDPWRGPHHG